MTAASRRRAALRRARAPGVSGVGDAGDGGGQRTQRQGDGRRGTAVDGDGHPLAVDARHLGHRGQHPALDRVVGPLAPGGIDAEMAGVGEEAGVLARTVVVGARERHAIGPRWRTAGQGTLVQADAVQPGAHGLDVKRLAAVRGAGERELRLAQPEGVGGAGFDQGQRLQHLDGRARVDRVLDIATRPSEPARRIGDGDSAAMAALHQVAARDLDQDRVHPLHPPSSTCTWPVVKALSSEAR